MVAEMSDEISLDPKTIMESVDRDLAYYRKCMTETRFYALAAIVAMVTGAVTFKIEQELVSNLISTAFLIAVVTANWIFIKFYKKRTHILRQAKIGLARKYGYNNIFPEPGEPSLLNARDVYGL
jgi:amino acid permease